VDAGGAGLPGLLLAGDAAGFIDPMTGDGLRFAVEGGLLAAEAALEALEHGRPDAHARLAERRARAFAAKQRFNRLLRSMALTQAGIGIGQVVARVSPSLVRSLIRHAGDVDLALLPPRVSVERTPPRSTATKPHC
jgi:flavin-dependent dehydrogenase